MFAPNTIKQRALEIGFDLVGIVPPSASKDLEFLPRWLGRRFAGELRYLADPRREDPRRVLPSVKSVICVALIYNAPYPYSTDVSGVGSDGENPTVNDAPVRDTRPRAWVSRYAWGKDYHDVMRGKLDQLRTAVEKLKPGVETRVYVDTGPIVERAFARISGIGWMGKNTCLINEQKGSWFFLGVILTNLEFESDPPAPDRCGSCTRCLEACPTGALVEPYVMDASRCISYLNIELKGTIPEQFRKAMGNNLFGCDICQDVCPWNNRPMSVVSGSLHDDRGRGGRSTPGTTHKRAATTDLPEFQPMQTEIPSQEAIAGPDSEDGSVPSLPTAEPLSFFHPTLEALASITEEDFRRLFAHSPIKRAKYRRWLRNLCVVVGNSGDQRFIPWLEAAAGHPDSMVREHAGWALHRLREGGECSPGSRGDQAS